MSVVIPIIIFIFISIITFILYKWHYKNNKDPKNFLKKEEIEKFYARNEDQEDQESQRSLPVSVTVINVGEQTLEESVIYEVNENFE